MGVDVAAFGGITAAQASSMLVVGSYTGDGTANREINIGGAAKFAMILGKTAGAVDVVWLLIKGQETYFAHPALLIQHAAGSNISSLNTTDVVSSTNGFTLAGTSTYDNNVNTNVYYYFALRAPD